MEAPDKIYNPLYNVEYIRKDALLEWLKECKENPVITDLQNGNIQEIIEKNRIAMTKEQAIKVLSESIHSGSKVPWDKIVEAVHLSIEALSRPFIPSNLDEAAKKYRDFREECGIKDPVMLDEIEEAHYAGAEWMAKQGVNLKCWISRDEYSGHKSNLYIGQQKPRRIPGTAPGFGMWSDYGEFMALPSDMFPELTYSDEPIEVELIIRKK